VGVDLAVIGSGSDGASGDDVQKCAVKSAQSNAVKVEKIKPISFTRLIRTNPIVLAYWTANPAGAQR